MSVIVLHTTAFTYDRQTSLSDARGIGKIKNFYKSDKYECDYIPIGQNVPVFLDILDTFPVVNTVALSEYGYISAARPALHIIDLVGLHNPVVAKEGLSERVLSSPVPDLIWLHWAYGKFNKDLRGLEAWKNYTYLPVLNGGLAVRTDSQLFTPQNRVKLLEILGCREIASGLSKSAAYR